jgi:hypothetical protein
MRATRFWGHEKKKGDEGQRRDNAEKYSLIQKIIKSLEIRVSISKPE